MATAGYHPGYQGGAHGYAHGSEEIQRIMQQHPEEVNYWDYVEHPHYFAEYWGVNKQYLPGFVEAGLEYTGMIDGRQTLSADAPDIEVGTGFSAIAKGDDASSADDMLVAPPPS